MVSGRGIWAEKKQKLRVNHSTGGKEASAQANRKGAIGNWELDGQGLMGRRAVGNWTSGTICVAKQKKRLAKTSMRSKKEPGLSIVVALPAHACRIPPIPPTARNMSEWAGKAGVQAGCATAASALQPSIRGRHPRFPPPRPRAPLISTAQPSPRPSIYRSGTIVPRHRAISLQLHLVPTKRVRVILVVFYFSSLGDFCPHRLRVRQRSALGPFSHPLHRTPLAVTDNNHLWAVRLPVVCVSSRYSLGSFHDLATSGIVGK